MFELQFGRHDAERFDVLDPFETAQRVQRTGRGRFGVVDEDILALAHTVLQVDHVIDRTLLESADDHDAAGHRDAERGQQGLDRLAFDMTQNHARRLREPPLQAEALDQGCAVDRRGLGSHRLCRRQPGRVRDRVQRTDDRHQHADQDGADNDSRLEHVDHERHAEKRHVDVAERLAHPDAGGDTAGDADADDQQHQLDVMQPDREIAVTEGLERGDLLALQTDQAADDDVEQKRGDAEKNHRENGGGGLLLFQLLGQEAARQLVLARVGADASVRLQEFVEPVDDVLFVGTLLQRQRNVVESAVHVVGGGQRLARGPQNSVTRVVGKQCARRDLINVFGRHRQRDDIELLAPAVDRRVQIVSGSEPVRVGELEAEQDFVVAARLEQPSLAQVDLVQQSAAFVGQRYQVAADRIVETGDVDADVSDHAGFDLVDAGNLGDALGQRQRRALERCENLREVMLAVVTRARFEQRIERAQRHDENADAADDDQRDREHLHAQVPQFAPELDVDRLHRKSLTRKARAALAWSG